MMLLTGANIRKGDSALVFAERLSDLFTYYPDPAAPEAEVLEHENVHVTLHTNIPCEGILEPGRFGEIISWDADPVLYVHIFHDCDEDFADALNLLAESREGERYSNVLAVVV